MNRTEFEHIIRASKSVTGETEFVVIGSQAILGQYPDAPRDLRQSMELDIYPKNKPELSKEIEGSLGRYSQFDTTYKYYADGVSKETAVLPIGWEERLVVVKNENTAGATACCLEAHDLAYSKLAAGREKDINFVKSLLKHKIIKPSQIKTLIDNCQDKTLKKTLKENFTTIETSLRKQNRIKIF